MKKVLSLTLIMIFLSTSISFSQPSSNTISALNDLSIVDSSLEITIKNILSGKYDKELIIKDLKFNESILVSIYNNTLSEYKVDKSSLKRREEVTIIYVSSLYILAINGIYLYLEESDINRQFFLDAISEYREANRVLNEFKNALRKSYNIEIK